MRKYTQEKDLLIFTFSQVRSGQNTDFRDPYVSKQYIAYT